MRPGRWRLVTSYGRSWSVLSDVERQEIRQQIGHSGEVLEALFPLTDWVWEEGTT